MPFTRPFLDPFTRVRIDGAINPSSVAQLALATRTTRVPSGDTAIARVTAAICGPTSPGHCSTTSSRNSTPRDRTGWPVDWAPWMRNWW